MGFKNLALEGFSKVRLWVGVELTPVDVNASLIPTVTPRQSIKSNVGDVCNIAYLQRSIMMLFCRPTLLFC